MSETKENNKTKDREKKTLSLNKTLDKVVDAGSVKQSFSHGRSKSVTVEVKKRRVIRPTKEDETSEVLENRSTVVSEETDNSSLDSSASSVEKQQDGEPQKPAGLTNAEWEVRKKVLAGALKNKDKEEKEYQEKLQQRKIETEERLKMQEERRQHEEALKKKEEEKEQKRFEEDQEKNVPQNAHEKQIDVEPDPGEPSQSVNVLSAHKAKKGAHYEDEEEDAQKKKLTLKKGAGDAKRREHKLTIQEAMVLIDDEGESTERQRSLASIRRKREKERLKQRAALESQKIVREVVIPETISVGELASRMSVRVVEVIRSLMGMGVIATANQIIDADTAELLVTEMGHNFKRISEADVEVGIMGEEDASETLQSRAPVITVMGHVDHGKTSLLDAIRQTDVASREAGGITQHIGAYQVKLSSGNSLTFLDTPGHAAFTAMRARGAHVTDIVVLVVAADDSVMQQTVEAIHHAQAAEVPIIVAINKIDVPSADPVRVKTELLQHNLVVEEMGGDVQCVEVSAKKKQNIDKLEEAILIQAEMLDLKANSNRHAIGTVIESKLEKGRGSVATILVQRGTLKVGDIFVAGTQWGKVRTLIDDHGQQVKEAGPSVPVEVVGFNGTSQAGDHFIVVTGESQARDIADYRARKLKNAELAATKKTMDQLFSSAQEGQKKELSLVIKTDVQGSLEAILGSFEKLNNDEVSVKILHGGVGGISESDIILAAASGGVVMGFNTRANQQARDLAKRDGVEIRYYSIIYDIIDDIKAALTGMLSPELKEEYLGTAEIRKVFNITKVGKIAGCYVRDGVVKRGAKVRLLRDDVVIHEGTLKTLKREKDEAKEVNAGMECGMAFENYQDIKEGDQIECFEIKEIKRSLT